MSDKPVGAPGCWGSIIAHNLDINECQTCEFKETCGKEALERRPAFIDRLTARDDQLGKNGLLVRPYNVSSKASEKTIAEMKSAIIVKNKQQQAIRFKELLSKGMTKKAAEIMAKLEKVGVDFNEVLEGVNPMNKVSSYPHLRQAFQLLLQNGSVKHTQLSRRWCDEFNWSPATARAMSSQFTAICKMIDGIEVEGKHTTMAQTFEQEVAA